MTFKLEEEYFEQLDEKLTLVPFINVNIETDKNVKVKI